MWSRTAPLLVATALAAACASTNDAPDQIGFDAEPTFHLDAGTGTNPQPDASQLADDAGTEPPDSGTLGNDDAGPADAGSTTTPDSGTSTNPDAGHATSDSGTTTNPDASMSPDSGAPATLNPGWIGGPCQSDTDCAFTGGTCLTEQSGWPGGTCSEPCMRTCPDQTGPQNSVTFCITDGDGDALGSCVSRCDYTLSPTGCRAGYVCLPEKRMSQPSVVRYACVPEAGVPNRAVPPFDIGAACTAASDCERNTCVTSLPAGYCTQEACDVVGCPTGSTCFSIGLEGFHMCIRDCAQSNECRESDGYICDSDNTCWYYPPPAGTCDLTGAAADCAAYAAQASSAFVVVTKHARRLAHCSGSTLLGAYCVGLGSSPVEDKEREGDRRTPEGIFYVPRKIPMSQYYKAFLISYPDIADADRGLMQGLITQSEHDAIVAAQNAHTEPPQSTQLGGLVEIHGGGSGSDWTWGCVANDNTTIDILWPSIQVGDTVVILH